MQETKEVILNYFRTGEFESAIDAFNRSGISLSDSDVQSVLDDFGKTLDEALSARDGLTVRMTRNRISGLTHYYRSGFQTNSVIPVVLLHEGYRGKILLVSISGGILDQNICIRSNDIYHREILRNTELEINDIGMKNAMVHQLGGAYLDDKQNDCILIWGGSDEFGACDKEFVARLLHPFYPDRAIVIED